MAAAAAVVLPTTLNLVQRARRPVTVMSIFIVVYRLMMCIFPVMGYVFYPWDYDSGHRFDNDAVRHHILPVAELDASRFNQETLRQSTSDFRMPVVVRGLHKDSVAVQTWHNSTRLSDLIGRCKVQFWGKSAGGLHRKSYMQQKAGCMYFSEGSAAVANLVNGTWAGTNRYVFGPYLGHTSDQQELSDRRNFGVTVADDIGVKVHCQPEGCDSSSLLKYSQIMLGNSDTGGTWWHNAYTANNFIQVIGSKRWTLMDPSINLQTNTRITHAVKGGVIAYTIDDPAFEECMLMTSQTCHVPGLMSVTIEPGDYLFVPPWWFHTIDNSMGLNLGFTFRAISMGSAFASAPLYHSRWLSDLMWDKLVGSTNLGLHYSNERCDYETLISPGHSEL